MKTHQRRALAAALMLGMALLAAVGALQGALLSSIIEHYQLSNSAQGAASAAASVGSMLALLGSFLLIGRLPKLTLLRLAFCLSAVALGLLKLVPVFGVFVTLWLLVGIGSGFIDMLLSSCMADLYEGRMATRMMCLLHTLFGLSSVVCPALYSRLIRGGVAWNDIYLFVSILALALVSGGLRHPGGRPALLPGLSGRRHGERHERQPVRVLSALPAAFPAACRTPPRTGASR